MIGIPTKPRDGVGDERKARPADDRIDDVGLDHGEPRGVHLPCPLLLRLLRHPMREEVCDRAFEHHDELNAARRRLLDSGARLRAIAEIEPHEMNAAWLADENGYRGPLGRRRGPWLRCGGPVRA